MWWAGLKGGRGLDFPPPFWAIWGAGPIKRGRGFKGGVVWLMWAWLKAGAGPKRGVALLKGAWPLIIPPYKGIRVRRGRGLNEWAWLIEGGVALREGGVACGQTPPP